MKAEVEERCRYCDGTGWRQAVVYDEAVPNVLTCKCICCDYWVKVAEGRRLAKIVAMNRDRSMSAEGIRAWAKRLAGEVAGADD